MRNEQFFDDRQCQKVENVYNMSYMPKIKEESVEYGSQTSN